MQKLDSFAISLRKKVEFQFKRLMGWKNVTLLFKYIVTLTEMHYNIKSNSKWLNNKPETN